MSHLVNFFDVMNFDTCQDIFLKIFHRMLNKMSYLGQLRGWVNKKRCVKNIDNNLSNRRRASFPYSVSAKIKT